MIPLRKASIQYNTQLGDEGDEALLKGIAGENRFLAVATKRALERLER